MNIEHAIHKSFWSMGFWSVIVRRGQKSDSHIHVPGARFTKEYFKFYLKIIVTFLYVIFFNVFFSKMHCNFVLEET